MELDPSLAEAHAAKGLLLNQDYQLRQAEKEYRTAVELKPSYAFAHRWYSLMLVSQLRWDEALDQIEKAVDLDPLSPVINLNHACHYLNKREYGRALELLKRVTEFAPDYSDTYYPMGWTHGRLHQFDEMRRSFATFVKFTEASYPLQGRAIESTEAYLRNDKETVRRLLPELEAGLRKTLLQDCEIGGICFYLGDVDKGFEWLERSFSKKEEFLLTLQLSDLFDGVPRSDPRYLNLLKRLELN